MNRPAALAIAAPIEPMLEKLAEELPTTDTFLFEPNRDGFARLFFAGVRCFGIIRNERAARSRKL